MSLDNPFRPNDRIDDQPADSGVFELDAQPIIPADEDSIDVLPKSPEPEPFRGLGEINVDDLRKTIEEAQSKDENPN